MALLLEVVAVQEAAAVLAVQAAHPHKVRLAKVFIPMLFQDRAVDLLAEVTTI